MILKMVAAKLIFGRTWQEYLGHKTSLALFVEVPVPSQESARSCIYMGHYQNTRPFSSSFFGDIKYFLSRFSLVV